MTEAPIWLKISILIGVSKNAILAKDVTPKIKVSGLDKAVACTSINGRIFFLQCGHEEVVSEMNPLQWGQVTKELAPQVEQVPKIRGLRQKGQEICFFNFSILIYVNILSGKVSFFSLWISIRSMLWGWKPRSSNPQLGQIRGFLLKIISIPKNKRRTQNTP